MLLSSKLGSNWTGMYIVPRKNKIGSKFLQQMSET